MLWLEIKLGCGTKFYKKDGIGYDENFPSVARLQTIKM